MEFIFVYGTLKKNFHNHRVIHDQRFISRGVTVDSEWKMLDLGAFPGVVSGQGVIHGEIYEVSDEAFKGCDRLEGYPTFYNRMRVQVRDESGEVHTCWMYYLNDRHHYDNYRVIPHGVW